MYELQKEEYLGNSKNIFNNTQGITVVETEYQKKVSKVGIRTIMRT